MTTDLIPFDFHGDTLLLADVEGVPHIVLKPAVDALGLDYPTQFSKLRERSWATVRLIPTVAADGKTRDMSAVDVQTFLMLLATINENRVAKDVKPRLVMYQREVAGAVNDYWTKGGAINPRASADQLEELRGQAAVLEALRNVVDPGWLDAKGRILAARALGEAPALDQSTKPLTVSIYLADRGVKAKRASSIAGMFGKRLKQRFIETYGVLPPQIEDVVGRHTVKVAQYQEGHRALFDGIWRDFYANEAS
jgi:hypothetical protein